MRILQEQDCYDLPCLCHHWPGLYLICRYTGKGRSTQLYHSYQSTTDSSPNKPKASHLRSLAGFPASLHCSNAFQLKGKCIRSPKFYHLQSKMAFGCCTSRRRRTVGSSTGNLAWLPWLRRRRRWYQQQEEISKQHIGEGSEGFQVFERCRENVRLWRQRSWER